MSRQSTPGGVPGEGAGALARARRMRGQSVKSMAGHNLEEALGADQQLHRLQRLQRYVTWSDDELVAFSEALESQRRVDSETWR